MVVYYLLPIHPSGLSVLAFLWWLWQ